MYDKNPIDQFYEFRTFMFGCKDTPQFPNGVFFSGVNEWKQMRGPSGALDLIVPLLDTFF